MGEEAGLKVVLVILSIGSLALAGGVPLILWVMSGLRDEIKRLYRITETIPPKLAEHAVKIEALERSIERRSSLRREG